MCLLTNSDFVGAVSHFWAVWSVQKCSYRSLQAWWNRGKEHKKEFAVRFSVEVSSARHSSQSILSSLYSHLKHKIDAGNASLLPVFKNVSNRISELDAKETDGASIHSRTRWAEEGESSTKFFLRLEKKWGSDGWISAMRSNDGSLATDINAICDPWMAFYSSLFSAAVMDSSEQSDLLDSLCLLVSCAERVV